MGASGLIELREAALLGFGRFDQFGLQQMTSTNLANLGSGSAVAYDFSLPNIAGGPFALGSQAQGASRRFALVGYLSIYDMPADLIAFLASRNPVGVLAQMSQGQIGALPWRPALQTQPILELLTPEQQTLTLAIAQRQYNALLPTGMPVMVDVLTGNWDALGDFLNWLHEGRAPASLIENVITGLASAVGDWY